MTRRTGGQRLLLALVGGILTWAGFGVGAFLLVVAVVMAVQGDHVDWLGVAIVTAIAAVVGLLGVWLVRRSRVPLGDAMNL